MVQDRRGFSGSGSDVSDNFSVFSAEAEKKSVHVDLLLCVGFISWFVVQISVLRARFHF